MSLREIHKVHIKNILFSLLLCSRPCAWLNSKPKKIDLITVSISAILSI